MMTYKPMKNGALNSNHLIQTIELIPCRCIFLIYPKNAVELISCMKVIQQTTISLSGCPQGRPHSRCAAPMARW